jgi:hypothetical protein
MHPVTLHLVCLVKFLVIHCISDFSHDVEKKKEIANFQDFCKFFLYNFLFPVAAVSKRFELEG